MIAEGNLRIAYADHGRPPFKRQRQPLTMSAVCQRQGLRAIVDAIADRDEKRAEKLVSDVSGCDEPSGRERLKDGLAPVRHQVRDGFADSRSGLESVA